jgi:hypothetical protein
MNLNTKKLTLSALIVIAGISTLSSAAYAETYKIIFDKVVAYDDGDNRDFWGGNGAGEIYMRLSVNGQETFSNFGKRRISLNDRGTDTYFFKKTSKTISIPSGQNIDISINGMEYDDNTENEHCRANQSHSKYDLGSKILDCGKSNGDLGLWLYYHIEKK